MRCPADAIGSQPASMTQEQHSTYRDRYQRKPKCDLQRTQRELGSHNQSPDLADLREKFTQHVGHQRACTFMTRLRKPSVAVSISPFAALLIRKPGSGTTGSTVSLKQTRVESPSGVNL